MHFHGIIIWALIELGFSGRHSEKPVIDNTEIHRQCVDVYVGCFRKLTQYVQ